MSKARVSPLKLDGNLVYVEHKEKALLITGGNRLCGKVRVSGSKNASLPIICASLLSSNKVVIKNVPLLNDVFCILEVLTSLGAKCEFVDGTLHIDPTTVDKQTASYEFVSKMRASFLVLGPLVARFKKARVPLPGGCNIGPRPVNEHLMALKELGTRVELVKGIVEATAEKLVGANITFNISSVGATENALSAAVFAEGVTLLENCAEEPEVEDLVNFLVAMGADIKNIGGRRLRVSGVKELRQREPYTVIPDRVEAGTYLVCIISTGGTGEILGCQPNHLVSFLDKLMDSGVRLEIREDAIKVLDASRIAPMDIRTQPYPGFPTDLQPQMVSLLTRAEGTSIVTDEIFPQRFSYVPELIRMGARIDLRESSAIIHGQDSPLTGAPVEGYDIRGCAALAIASLSGRGKSLIRGYDHLERGYHHFVEKLRALGAEVSLVDKTYRINNQASHSGRGG